MDANKTTRKAESRLEEVRRKDEEEKREVEKKKKEERLRELCKKSKEFTSKVRRLSIMACSMHISSFSRSWLLQECLRVMSSSSQPRQC